MDEIREKPEESKPDIAKISHIRWSKLRHKCIRFCAEVIGIAFIILSILLIIVYNQMFQFMVHEMSIMHIDRELMFEERNKTHIWDEKKGQTIETNADDLAIKIRRKR